MFCWGGFVTHLGCKTILLLGIQVSWVKSTWVITDLVSPSFCLLNNVSLRHPITASFLLVLHECSVLFSSSWLSTALRKGGTRNVLYGWGFVICRAPWRTRPGFWIECPILLPGLSDYDTGNSIKLYGRKKHPHPTAFSQEEIKTNLAMPSLCLGVCSRNSCCLAVRGGDEAGGLSSAHANPVETWHLLMSPAGSNSFFSL